MINSETKNGATVTAIEIAGFLKPTCGAGKKAALRDVQNDKKNIIHNHQLTLVGGKQISDAAKFSGVKRPTPEHPSSSPNQQFWTGQCTNEHLLNARRRFDLELGKGRFQKSMGKFADSPQPNNLYVQQEAALKQTQRKEKTTHRGPTSRKSSISSAMPLRHPGNSASNIISDTNNGLPAESDNLKVVHDSHYAHNSIDLCELRWEERFLHLQNFLKLSNESNRDYSQVLLRFSPAELSRHAVELEKRAIHLAWEEGNEMKRLKILNILGKSVPASSGSLQSSQPLSKT